ncbi:hypothetical protein DSO57_1024314 [Entomophthora muscae]|uniref:Uncharacterized protein n=1 Tax=Entomophthora muscae TaxID=34485 RepID=A0ACC2T2T4_9FUNG|nr:hypothetical protein DSO57_1024314 [Entomophthora muscae]
MSAQNSQLEQQSTDESTSPSYGGIVTKHHYPFTQKLRFYNPEVEMAKEEQRKRNREATRAEARKEKRVLKIHGVNLLNRDSIEVSDIIEHNDKRRQQHTNVERRRRELINSSIATLGRMLPSSFIDHDNNNASGLILQQAIHYIEYLQQENTKLKDLVHKK